MFTRWPPIGDDAWPWRRGPGGARRQSAPAPTCWSTRWVATRSRRLRRRASSSTSSSRRPRRTSAFPPSRPRTPPASPAPTPPRTPPASPSPCSPRPGASRRPAAVSLVEDDDWPAGIAAASLVAPPIRAPILVTGSDEIPDFTADALGALAPAGSAKTDGKQIFAIGSATAPRGLDRSAVSGSNPAEIAAEIDRLRQKLTGTRPQHILLASSEQPAFAMPAAAWAARSGDPVLFVEEASGAQAHARRASPPPGRPGLRARPAFGDLRQGARGGTEGGPEREADRRRRRIRSRTRSPSRATSSGDFGWDINDPGHGFVIASASRPLDAAAAAPLSASGSLGTAADHRRRSPGSRCAARIPARRQAGLRGRSDARRLQPRLGDRRPGRDLGRLPVAGRRSRRARTGKVRPRDPTGPATRNAGARAAKP